MQEDILKTITEYKKGKLDLYEAIALLDIENESNDKKNEGVIYTPKHIADHIVKNLGYKIDKTIIEPSVGHGVFVFSLIEYVESNFGLKGNDLKKWFEEYVFCFDINEKNIQGFKSLLTVYFNKKGIQNVDFKNIQVADTLFYPFKHSFDFSFGNPPYIRTKNLEARYLLKLRESYRSCSTGNVDICYAFMELMNDISNVSSFIVPNGYTYNAAAKNLRTALKDNLVSIIDFKDYLVFSNARTYTSIYKTDKNANSSIVLYKEKIEDEFIEVCKSNLKDQHWVFTEDFSYDKNGVSILDKYPCYSSIATLKDKLYIIESPKMIKENGKKYFIKEYNGQEYKIETDICIDFFKITKMGKDFKIIFPYDEKSNILDENTIIKKYPFTYEYFKAIRPELDNRDKGKVSKYDSWYAYGRKQGLQTKSEAVYLFLPLMATEEYTCHKMNNLSNFLLTSGFVLGFDNDEEATKVKDILESGIFFEYIKSKGRPWAGKTPYYSFTKTHLKDFLI